jgi:hypothetical protein
MIGRFLRKFVIFVLILAAMLAVAVPPGLYWLGLNNIDGRPTPPNRLADLGADSLLLQRNLRMQGPIVIHALNPWTFFRETLFEIGMRSPSAHERSMRAVAIIAMRYNSTHLRNHQMIWWHLSEMSMTIWLTRNWTTAEIVTAAAAIPRSGLRRSLPN